MIKPLSDEKCLWSQFRREKDYKVCAKCFKSGHFKSKCLAPHGMPMDIQRSSFQVHFTYRMVKKRIKILIFRKLKSKQDAPQLDQQGIKVRKVTK